MRILEQPALGTLDSLQPAVDAALDGQTLLVGGGDYAGFTIDDKTLVVVAMRGQSVHVAGTITVQNLALQRWVALIDLDATGSTPASTFIPPPAGAALRLTNNQGHVHAQGCDFEGGRGAQSSSSFAQHGDGGPAVSASQSERVSLAACLVRGGEGGATYDHGLIDTYGGDGGRGLDCTASRVVLHECDVAGGLGGEAGCRGGPGGDACHLSGLSLYAYATSFAGGDGGDQWDFLCDVGGDGGDGLDLDANAQAETLGCTFAGGQGGFSCTYQVDAPDGNPIAGSGNLVQHSGTARSFAAPTSTPEKSMWNVTVWGEPGDQIAIAHSPAPSFSFVAPATGIELLPAGSPTYRAIQSVVPPSGVAQVAVRIGRVQGGSPFLFLQGWTRDASGTTWHASPLHLLVFDRESLPDCDGNAQSDLVDVIEGLDTDLDHNLQRDSCDPDCNGNGFADGYDVLSASSHDCDGNAVPDECDIAGGASLDCNANGYPDDCDIASGTSTDGNTNGVPDDCESNRVWHVDDDALPGGDGSSASPFRTLAEGLGASISGDTVLVHDGLYVGPANRGLSFLGRDLVVASTGGAANCVIDCEGQGTAFALIAQESAASRIEGLTIRNGNQPSSFHGGAVRLDASSPVVRDCVFEGCASRFGGAIYALNSSARIEGCIFRDNDAVDVGSTGWGGAVYLRAGSVSFERCTFASNSARIGGALAWERLLVSGSSKLTVSHCRFLGNSSTLHGGALVVRATDSAPVNLDQCLFAGNSAGTDGGALWSDTTSGSGSFCRVFLTNSTLVGNSAFGAGGGYFADDGADTKLINSILWSNQAPFGAQIAVDMSTSSQIPGVKVEFCDVQGGQAGVFVQSGAFLWSGGNLALDPLFVDADGPDGNALTFADNDYRLGAGSACVDAGRNGVIQPDLVDIDGDGDFDEKVPLDLGLATRRFDDPAVPDTGLGNSPLVDFGAFERHP